MGAAMIRRSLAWLASAAAALTLLQAQVALAGSLSVLPVRVEVAASKRFCSLTIGNDGAEDVTVQVRGLRWYQRADGKDMLDETQRIAINPSIVTIPAGTKRLVRCSLPAQAGPVETTYRLIVSELPRSQTAPGTLEALLQLSIPVFRSQPGASPSLHWSAGGDGQLIVTNTGLRHARVARLALRGAAGERTEAAGGFYLLAGASRVIPAAMPAAAVTAVEATAEDGSAIPVSFQHGSVP
jgi:fimbrial chaperone protein